MSMATGPTAETQVQLIAAAPLAVPGSCGLKVNCQQINSVVLMLGLAAPPQTLLARSAHYSLQFAFHPCSRICNSPSRSSWLH